MVDTFRPARASIKDGAVMDMVMDRPIKRARRRPNATGLLVAICLPALCIYLAFFAAPVLSGFYYALTRWDGVNPPQFIGLDNFARLAQDGDARAALLNTCAYTLIIVIIMNTFALGLALLVRQSYRGVTFLRTALFVPVVLSSVVVAFLWGYLYNPLTAVLGRLLALGGWTAMQDFDFLGNPRTALPAVALTVIWQYAGYLMVIYLAGLQSIPADLYEAADVDGANSWDSFWGITLPMLRGATTIAVVLSLIGALRLFDQVWLLTQGGPAGATDTLATLVYKASFSASQFGYGAAIAVVLTFFVVVVSGAQYILSMRGEAT